MILIPPTSKTPRKLKKQMKKFHRGLLEHLDKSPSGCIVLKPVGKSNKYDVYTQEEALEELTKVQEQLGMYNE